MTVSPLTAGSRAHVRLPVLSESPTDAGAALMAAADALSGWSCVPTGPRSCRFENGRAGAARAVPVDAEVIEAAGGLSIQLTGPAPSELVAALRDSLGLLRPGAPVPSSAKPAVLAEPPQPTPVTERPTPDAPRAAPPSVPPVPAGAVPRDDTVRSEGQRGRSARAAAAGPRFALLFDDGGRFDVGAFALVGRDPQPGPGDPPGDRVAVRDPGRSISKTHLAFGFGPQGAWVFDRFSTNGTLIEDATGVRTAVEPGRQVLLPEGATVHLGDRSFTVERVA